MSLALRYAARSDVGLVREGNEDSGYAGPALLLVADGMGGHAAGELASAIAVALVADLDVHPPEPDDVLSALADAVADVGDGISDVIADDPDLTGMGTTVTGLYWLGSQMALVHIGDSRAYLLRDDELAQITHDHSYVQTLVDAGRITEEEAGVHPRRSLLMRALDGLNPVEADLALSEARVGDRYMLCTDGLSGVVSLSEMSSLMRDGDPTGAVTRLVDLALERGAPDNVTVVVALGLAGAFAIATSWLSTQWYVALNGSAGTGTVAVYRGIQGTLLGYSLSTLDSDSGLQVGQLPYFDQELVSKGIPAADEADADRIVTELEDRAAECQTIFSPSGCPGSLQ